MRFKYYIRKILVFLLTVTISIAIASLFGIIHDQITYTISPEYYTKFKFYQFGLTDSDFGYFQNTRAKVAIVGVLATWWVGKWVGIFLGSMAFMATESLKMRRTVLKGLGLIFITTVVFSIAGFIRGRYFLEKKNWGVPGEVLNRDNFIIVGSIHNYSYLGGIVGLLIAAIYLFWQANKNDSKNKGKRPVATAGI